MKNNNIKILIWKIFYEQKKLWCILLHGKLSLADIFVCYFIVKFRTRVLSNLD